MPKNKNELNALSLLGQAMKAASPHEPVPSWSVWFGTLNGKRPGLLQRWNDFALRRLIALDDEPRTESVACDDNSPRRSVSR